jgi:hypothetical protein
MWGVQLRENLDFLLYILNLVLCALKIDDLDCYGLLSSLVVTGGIANEITKRFPGFASPFVNFSKGTLSCASISERNPMKIMDREEYLSCPV